MKKPNTITIGILTVLTSALVTFAIFLIDTFTSFSILKTAPFLKNKILANCSGIGFWLNCKLNIGGWLLVDLIIFTIFVITVLLIVKKRK